jgi:hypothetical protein
MFQYLNKLICSVIVGPGFERECTLTDSRDHGVWDRSFSDSLAQSEA